MVAPHSIGMEPALAALNAAGEETRLRLLALLAESELTVSEVVAILGQSQPRVSRHLKLLVEAGLVERRREGAWAFFRLAAVRAPRARPRHRRVARPRAIRCSRQTARVSPRCARRGPKTPPAILPRMPTSGTTSARCMCPRRRSRRAIREAVGDAPMRLLLDLGAGAGRMLELFAPQARTRHRRRSLLGDAGGRPRAAGGQRRCATCNCVRATSTRCRSSAIPAISRSCIRCCTISTIPAARCARRRARWRPGGRLLVVDFAPHEEEALRDKHAHRRLGFSDDGNRRACWPRPDSKPILHRDLAPALATRARKLTVSLWLARDPRIIADRIPATAYEIA